MDFKESKEVKEGKETKFNKTHTSFKKRSPEDIAYPKHIVAMIMLIKNNAEIKRFTAHGIINYLTQKNEIVGNSKYVSFKWNKFTVFVDGLARDFSYREPFFINSLVASFSSFANSAQRTIDKFCNIELKAAITDVVNKDDVDNIITFNEQVIERDNETKDNGVVEHEV